MIAIINFLYTDTPVLAEAPSMPICISFAPFATTRHFVSR